jgi:hypothetical protein
LSGQRVILLIAAGVLGVALVTLALYFLTRQVDETSPSEDGLPRVPAALSLSTVPDFPSPFEPSGLRSYACPSCLAWLQSAHPLEALPALGAITRMQADQPVSGLL